jgi:hypothetical protein
MNNYLTIHLGKSIMSCDRTLEIVSAFKSKRTADDFTFNHDFIG